MVLLSLASLLLNRTCLTTPRAPECELRVTKCPTQPHISPVMHGCDRLHQEVDANHVSGCQQAEACRLVDALEWLVGWFHGLPELIPKGFPWQLLQDLAPDIEPAPVAAEPAGMPCLA